MDPRRFCSSVTPTVTDSEPEDRGVRGPSMEPWKMTRRLPEGPWDPTKIPRIHILMSRVVFLVGTGGIPFPQVESQIGRTVSVRKIQLDKTDLITRRSEVQILPPPLRSPGERLDHFKWLCAVTTFHRGES